MRNPDRIDPILAEIRDLWVKYPDLRLCQLIVCAIKPSEPCPQVFYVEDDVFSNRLETLADEMVAAPPPQDPCTTLNSHGSLGERDPGDINDPDHRRESPHHRPSPEERDINHVAYNDHKYNINDPRRRGE